MFFFFFFFLSVFRCVHSPPQVSQITLTHPHLLSSHHVFWMIMRQIVNRGCTGRLHIGTHLSCVSGDWSWRQKSPTLLLTVLASLHNCWLTFVQLLMQDDWCPHAQAQRETPSHSHQGLQIDWHFWNPSHHILPPFALSHAGNCSPPLEMRLCDDEQPGMNHHLTSPCERMVTNHPVNDTFDPFKAINPGCAGICIDWTVHFLGGVLFVCLFVLAWDFF